MFCILLTHLVSRAPSPCCTWIFITLHNFLMFQLHSLTIIWQKIAKFLNFCPYVIFEWPCRAHMHRYKTPERISAVNLHLAVKVHYLFIHQLWAVKSYQIPHIMSIHALNFFWPSGKLTFLLWRPPMWQPVSLQHRNGHFQLYFGV